MRFVTVATAMIFALTVQSATLVAQGRGNGQVKKTSVSTPKAKSSTQTPKHTAAKPATANAKPASKIETRAGKADTRAVKAETKVARKTPAATAAAPPPTLTTTVISPETPTTHSVKNPKLEARLLTLLPAGTNIHDASPGVQELGSIRCGGACLEQPEYSVRGFEGEDDGHYARHECREAPCRPHRCRSARRFNPSRAPRGLRKPEYSRRRKSRRK